VALVKVAIDTNVLAYAEGTNGAVMRDAVLSLFHGQVERKKKTDARTFGPPEGGPLVSSTSAPGWPG